MKIAIPEYKGRVSPVFDTCQRLLVFQIDNAGLGDASRSDDWSYLPVVARINRFQQLGIDVLLCGGISDWLTRQVEGQGIRLVTWLAEAWVSVRQNPSPRVGYPFYARRIDHITSQVATVRHP